MDEPYETDHLDALYAIAKLLARGADQRTALAEILAVLETRLGMLRGTILLLSTSGAELRIEAARNVTPQTHASVRYRRGEGIVGQVVETAQPVVVPDVQAEPRFLNRIHRETRTTDDPTSFVCVPITVGQNTIGTLSVDLPLADQQRLHDSERLLSVVSTMIANDVKSRREAELERVAYQEENLRLRNALGEQFRPENLIGNAGVMRDVYARIFQVAAADTTVLIRGESGTGKELVASAIHYNSPRAKQPFVKVNCAALNENLLESELFGHEKGAFTGALNARAGRIEQAEGGTLFLDEIGEFSPTTQVKLLRVLQEREYERVGSNDTRPANVRVIAATNSDLDAGVRDGTFRQDLFYRINVFPLALPPLRERGSDILLLADHFVQKYGRRMGKVMNRISTPAINMLMAYHWPGNVRELENCIEHAVLLSTDGVIHGHTLPPTLQMPTASGEASPNGLKESVAVLETEMIVEALKRTGGNYAAAARELGVTSRILRYKVKQYQITL